jgi:hypothetical protein
VRALLVPGALWNPLLPVLLAGEANHEGVLSLRSDPADRLGHDLGR